MPFLKRIVVSLVSILLAIGPLVPQASAKPKRGPSTPEERARALRIAKTLRADPMTPHMEKDRAWLVGWLAEVPDISVTICPGMTGDLGDSKKSDYPPALLAVLIASQAAFIIENRDKEKDENAVYLGGVEGLLDGYQAIRFKDPGYRVKQLDDFIQSRTEGKLAEAVASAAANCNKRVAS